MRKMLKNGGLNCKKTLHVVSLNYFPLMYYKFPLHFHMYYSRHNGHLEINQWLCNTHLDGKGTSEEMTAY